MKSLKCKLENCYGIGYLEHNFKFEHDNAVAIYAKNGLMKTSFSKTFKKIQENKESDIKDEIFNKQGDVNILIDDSPIKPENIFVIKSFENYYESDSISDLLVDNNVKNKIDRILNLRNRLLSKIEKMSGLKIKKIYQGKNIYELEPTIIKDLELNTNSILLSINEINKMECYEDLSHIQYSSIFNDSVIRKIYNNEFQNRIDNYIESSEVIYKNFKFLKKGRFSVPKLKKVYNTLDKQNFFVNDNYIYLDGSHKIDDNERFTEVIRRIDEDLKKSPEFKEIEKLLSDVKGSELKEIIENNPEIIDYLKIENLKKFKKQLWISYFNELSEEFQNLNEEFRLLEEELDAIDLNDTIWMEALNIFKSRFDVPYEMVISNLKSAIIGESLPRIEFKFIKNDDTVMLKRDELENIDILSQGERRALYLLNIIFDIEKMKQSDSKKVIIIDDIADSFDYRNKYAIIEYICELIENPNFYLIILSHNFDFYRTVSSRLGLRRESRYHAESKSGVVSIKQEFYQNKPFDSWKNNLNYTNIIALIPFVRNIIELKCKTANKDSDYLKLTSLLHVKKDSEVIKFNDLIEIFSKYIYLGNIKNEVNLDSIVMDEIQTSARKIISSSSNLENKIVLSIAIRHLAEKFMINEIKEYPGQLTYKRGKKIEELNSNQILKKIENKGNQTRELYNIFKQIGTNQNIKLLDEVNIMTPENIHINSFMYEPILDSDIIELKKLYENLDKLK